MDHIDVVPERLTVLFGIDRPEEMHAGSEVQLIMSSTFVTRHRIFRVYSVYGEQDPY